MVNGTWICSVVIVILLPFCQGIAQPVVFRGTVVSETSETLPSAVVVLLAEEDSTFSLSTQTTIDGVFILVDSVPKSVYLLQITFVGFNPYYKTLERKSETEFDLGLIQLVPSAMYLNQVTINEKRERVILNRDTTEFLAETYGVPEHSPIEILLRKLPGIDVNRDGTLEADGVQVTKVLIDGREIFGGDIQSVTKNLPADAIEKVSVVDSKSDAERFSHATTGNGKTINLKLKKSYKKIRFGDVSGSVGTERRYEGDAQYNAFQNGNQLIVTGNSNNVNNQGSDEDMLAGLQVLPVLTMTHSGGVHFLKNTNSRWSVNGSYRPVVSSIRTGVSGVSTIYLPEGLASFSHKSSDSSSAISHQANIGLQYEDSVNTFKFSSSGNVADLSSGGTSLRYSRTPEAKDGNSSYRTFEADNENLSADVQLFFGHRFIKVGRSIALSANASLFESDLATHSFNTTTFNSGVVRDEILTNHRTTHTRNYNLKFAYSEPLGRGQSLTASYNISAKESKASNNGTHLIQDTVSQNITVSSLIQSRFDYEQIGLHYEIARKTYALTFGSVLQRAVLTRTLIHEAPLRKSYLSVLPTLTGLFLLSSRTKLQLQYNTLIREPSISEMYPVEINDDPLNTFVINPALQPEYGHQGRITISGKSQAQNPIYITGGVSYSLTTTPIVAAINVDDVGLRTTKFVNANDRQSLRGNTQITIPWNWANSTFKVGGAYRFGQFSAILNDAETRNTEASLGVDFVYSYNYKQIFEFTLAGYKDRSLLASFAFPSQVLNTQGIEASVYLLLAKKVKFQSAFKYSALINEQTDFQQEFPLLNLSMGILLSKDGSSELTIRGFNLMNENNGAIELSSTGYVEQRVYNTFLGRYYSLAFTYRFTNRRM